MLRDVVIFMLGIAAVTVTVHYVFIRNDPMAECQNAIVKNFTQDIQRIWRKAESS
jgi:hypothetical protein